MTKCDPKERKRFLTAIWNMSLKKKTHSVNRESEKQNKNKTILYATCTHFNFITLAFNL